MVLLYGVMCMVYARIWFLLFISSYMFNVGLCIAVEMSDENQMEEC
jgi:hypothetical protein